MKYPGHEMAFWSLLFFVACAVVGTTSFLAGKMGMGVLMVLPAIGCALLWFDVREAKWMVVAFLCLTLLAGTVALFAKDFSWRILLRLAGQIYITYFFATWDGNPKGVREEY